MKWEMHENSLFAVLLRNPWWISAAVAVGLALVARFFLPIEYALFVGLPFAIIAAVRGWQELRAPSAGRIAKTVERVRAMPWDEFAAELEAAYKREGYTVSRIGGAADFELVKASRTTLVACKRWKATRTGIEPLRELEAARDKREAHECCYVATGEFSDTARAFAAAKRIKLVEGGELATLLA
jgi:restriction system protein